MRWLRKRTDQDFRDEIEANIALDTDRFIAEGMNPDDARAAARRAFGNVTRAHERFYESRRVLWLDDVGRDLKYAIRSLAKNPGFAAVAILTLALAIGVNTAIFSVVNALLLKPLPYPHSDRIVRLLASVPAAFSPTGAPIRTTVGLTAQEIDLVRSHSRTLSNVATAGPALLGLSGYEGAARLQGAQVSSNAFDMLEVQPLVGRTLKREDDTPGAPSVVLISATAWKRYFGRDPAIVGRSVTLDSVLGPRRETLYTIVGVLPDLGFPRVQTQFWIPLRPLGTLTTRGPMVARLRDGISLQAATTEVAGLVREIRRGQRGNDVATYELAREQDDLVAPIKPALFVLVSAVGLVLFIACANVANLLLARSMSRQKELSIRVAIGAARGRLIRQVLTESIALGVLGGAIGIALAFGLLVLLRRFAITASRFDLASDLGVPRLEEVGMDVTVLLFAVAVSIVAGVVFGLVPAMRVSQLKSAATLQSDRGANAVGTSFTGLRNALVMAEVALATMVLVAGALLVRSFVALSSVTPGYSAEHVLTFQVALPVSRYPDARLRTFAEDLVERLRSTPGIQATGYANQLPLVQLRDTAGGLWTMPDPQRKPAPSGPDARLVSRDYLGTMGIRVVAGRGFTERDGAGSPRVLLLNETLARQQFVGKNPIGQSVFIGHDVTPWEIVGIVADVRQFGLDKAPEGQFFINTRQAGDGVPLFPVGAYYTARTTGDPMVIVPQLRRIVRDLDNEAALFNVAPMGQLVAATISRPRLYSAFLGLFAGVGVAIAALGVYGVLAYTVTQRTREIGIRVALGARSSTVLRLVLRQGMTLAAIGIGVGLLGAVGTTQYLRTMLFGLTPLDPTTFVAVAGLFLVIAAAASIVPARRATKVDPLVALRAE